MRKPVTQKQIDEWNGCSCLSCGGSVDSIGDTGDSDFLSYECEDCGLKFDEVRELVGINILSDDESSEQEFATPAGRKLVAVVGLLDACRYIDSAAPIDMDNLTNGELIEVTVTVGALRQLRAAIAEHN